MRVRSIWSARGLAVALLLAAAVPAAAQSVQPTVPIAINKDVFNGTVKGFLAPDELILNTKLSDAAFTGFFGSASASAMAGYVYDPASIPSLQLGDVVNLASSTAASVYDAMGTKWPAGSVIVAAVVAFDAGAQQGTVCGFATVRVDKVDSRSNPKFIDVRLVALDPPTLAQ